MATKLDKELKREIDIKGTAYMVTFSPTGIKLVEKGRRNGSTYTWEQILRGDVTVGGDLKQSLE